MSTSNNAAVRLLRCGVGSDWFGIEEARVRGIRRLGQQWKCQHREGSQVGTLPGPTPVPVHSLHALLERPGAVPGGSYVVLLHDEKQPWGLLAEKVASTVIVPVRQTYPLPAILGTRARHWIQDVAVLESGLFLRLAVDRLLTPSKRPSVREEPLVVSAPVIQPDSSVLPGASRALVCQLREARDGVPALHCVFSLSQTCDIREPLPLTPVPGTPPWLAGLANWREQPLPVVDATAMAGQTPLPRDVRQRMVVVQGPQGHKLGFLVPALMQLVAKLPAATPLPLGDVAFPPRLLRGAWRTAERHLVMLSLDGLYRDAQVGAG